MNYDKYEQNRKNWKNTWSENCDCLISARVPNYGTGYFQGKTKQENICSATFSNFCVFWTTLIYIVTTGNGKGGVNPELVNYSGGLDVSFIYLNWRSGRRRQNLSLSNWPYPTSDYRRDQMLSHFELRLLKNGFKIPVDIEKFIDDYDDRKRWAKLSTDITWLVFLITFVSIL